MGLLISTRRGSSQEGLCRRPSVLRKRWDCSQVKLGNVVHILFLITMKGGAGSLARTMNRMGDVNITLGESLNNLFKAALPFRGQNDLGLKLDTHISVKGVTETDKVPGMYTIVGAAPVEREPTSQGSTGWWVVLPPALAPPLLQPLHAAAGGSEKHGSERNKTTRATIDDCCPEQHRHLFFRHGQRTHGRNGKLRLSQDSFRAIQDEHNHLE